MPDNSAPEAAAVITLRWVHENLTLLSRNLREYVGKSNEVRALGFDALAQDVAWLNVLIAASFIDLGIGPLKEPVAQTDVGGEGGADARN